MGTAASASPPISNDPRFCSLSAPRTTVTTFSTDEMRGECRCASALRTPIGKLPHASGEAVRHTFRPKARRIKLGDIQVKHITRSIGSDQLRRSCPCPLIREREDGAGDLVYVGQSGDVRKRRQAHNTRFHGLPSSDNSNLPSGDPRGIRVAEITTRIDVYPCALS